MIFQKSLKEKSLTLRLFLSFWRESFLIMAFFCILPVLFAAKLEFDIQPGTFTINIERLNSPDTNPDLSASQQTKIEAVPNIKTTLLPDFLEKIFTTFPHIFATPESSTLISSQPNANASQVLQPPNNGSDLEGVGEKELVALRDGTANIEVLLSTYSPASMEVHLYDADGSEIWFNGQSLLIWQRPDDKADAPLSFKGKTDSSSMVKGGGGDYSPAENLSYSIEMKEGQKLLLKTGGQAEPRSYIRVKGSAF